MQLNNVCKAFNMIPGSWEVYNKISNFYKYLYGINMPFNQYNSTMIQIKPHQIGQY